MGRSNRGESDKIFLFVNRKSGGQKGEFFLQIEQPLRVHLKKQDREVTLHIYELLAGRSGDMPGFHALREATQEAGVDRVRVIVGGGDGTIMWVVTESKKHHIDGAKLYFGVSPLGTGNDFSRALGWGGTNPNGEALLADHYAGIRDLVEDWVAGVPALHDVWEVELRCCEEEGEIYQRDVILEDSQSQRPVRSKNMFMLLYSGVAKDAEVLYKVEMHRMGNQFCNHVMYGIQAIRVMMHWFCGRGQRVRRVIKGLYNGEDCQARPIFEYDSEQSPHLTNDAEMLVFLNVNSYGGGMLSKLWDHSGRLGVSDTLDDELLDRDQDPGDGKLEVMTLRRLLRVVSGHFAGRLLGGRRIFQGSPFYLAFRRRRSTYLHVDGESYFVVNPKSLLIRHSQVIQVLQRQEPERSWCCRREQLDSSSESGTDESEY